MKKIFSLFFALIVSLGVNAQRNSDREPYFTKSLSNDVLQEVFARTSGGNISVSGVDRSGSRVEVYIRGNNNSELSTAEIKERLSADYDLTVSVTGNKLSATATPKHTLNWKHNLSISFKIYVTSAVSTDLKTSGGNIALTNLTGTHDFSTSGGSLEISKLKGKVYGKTSGGSISVSDTQEDIQLSTSGGNIKADHCEGTISLSTSGGSISLSSLKGTTKARTSGGTVRGSDVMGELIVHTSGGNISLLELSGSVDASTSGGNLDIEIEKLGKYVTASNSGGNIRLKMPGDKGMNLSLRGERIKIDALQNFSGEQDEHRITGKMNGGGIPIDVHTNGTLTLALQ